MTMRSSAEMKDPGKEKRCDSCDGIKAEKFSDSPV